MKKLYGIEVPDCYPNHSNSWDVMREVYNFEKSNVKKFDTDIELHKNYLYVKNLANIKEFTLTNEYTPINISKLANENNISLNEIGISLNITTWEGYDSIEKEIKLSIGKYEETLNENIKKKIEEIEKLKQDWIICEPYIKIVEEAREKFYEKEEIKELEKRLKELKNKK